MLKGKIALVTGGSRGIGSAICVELAKAGAKVIINYSNSKESANNVLEEIVKNKGEAEVVGFDVSNFSLVDEKIKDLIERHGKIDILVNNAGITRDSLFMRMKESQWDEVFETNTKGVFNCTKSVVRMMLKNQYGKIINITSVVGEMGNPGQVNYSSSKSALIGTEITDVLSDTIKEKYKEIIPLSRFGSPEDVAKAVLFLASDDSSYITGEVLKINGGLYT